MNEYLIEKLILFKNIIITINIITSIIIIGTFLDKIDNNTKMNEKKQKIIKIIIDILLVTLIINFLLPSVGLIEKLR